MRELSHVVVTQIGDREWQATGRDPNGGYLGSEFAETQGAAIQKVFDRAKAAGVKVVKQRVEKVTEKPKRPAKVGPDRIMP